MVEKLNKLMFNRYHAYHDFPAEKFNIDHILIGPAGVFVKTLTQQGIPVLNPKKEIEIHITSSGPKNIL